MRGDLPGGARVQRGGRPAARRARPAPQGEPIGSDLEAARARWQCLGAAALFSTGGAVIKAVHATAWQVASFRSGLAALALLVMLPSAWRGITWRAWLVAIAHGATLVLFVLANKLTTSANAIFLQSTAPIYVTLLGPLVLRERLHRRDLFALAAMAVGLSLFFVGTEPPRATAPNPAAGNAIAVASGVSWALTVVGLRWMGRGDSGGPVGTASAVACGNVLAALVTLPLALQSALPGPRDWGLLAFLGIVQIGCAYALLAHAFRHVRALEASLLLLAEPVLNPAWAWVVHGETPSALAAAGGVIILGATLGAALARSRS